MHIVILAAGKGTRMRSSLPKVLHPVAGVPMLQRVMATAAALAPEQVVLVVGHDAERVRSAAGAMPVRLSRLSVVVQEPQLGTAHALQVTAPQLASAAGTLLLLSGDVPFLSPDTLRALASRHEREGAAMTVATAVVERPDGYGRVVRSGSDVARIVEDRDASDAERSICEINAGIYAFALEGLFEALGHVAANNAQGEFYLPDLVGVFRQQGRRVETLVVADPREIRGVNSRAELADMSRLVRQAKNDALMASGVTLLDPATAYIDDAVSIGPDTVVHPGVTIEGSTTVGAGCEIRSGVRLTNATVADGAVVLDHSVVTDSTLGQGVRVGPFAHLRNGAVVADGARVGNFVELKHTVLGAGSKAMHHAYLGDAVIGQQANIGAGTITCNYDGARKHQTTIEDGAFVGSDSQLVAPVTIGKGAYVGSGSTIREDVPAGALAVSAGKQRNIEGWVGRKAKGHQKG